MSPPFFVRRRAQYGPVLPFVTNLQSYNRLSRPVCSSRVFSAHNDWNFRIRLLSLSLTDVCIARRCATLRTAERRAGADREDDPMSVAECPMGARVVDYFDH